MHISNIYLEFPNDMNLAELLTLVLTLIARVFGPFGLQIGIFSKGHLL